VPAARRIKLEIAISPPSWPGDALALNPSYARGWNNSGILRVWAEQPDCAIEHVENSLRLSVVPAFTVIGTAHFLSRRFDQAVPKLLLATQEDDPSTYRVLAARYAHLGRLDEARGIIKRLRAIVPVLVPDAAISATPSKASCISRVCAWRWANRHSDRLNGGNPPPLRRVPGIRTRRSRRGFALPAAARHGLVNFAFPVAGPAATRSPTTPSPTGNPSSFQVR
jgi:hypothetical protein